MEKIHMEHFEVETEKFDHFLKGDGEIWFDNNNGEFLTRIQVDAWLKENNIPETEEEVKDAIREFDLVSSFNELDAVLDYYYDGEYDLDYLIIGETAILNIARKF